MKAFLLAGFLVISLMFLECNSNPANDLDSINRSNLVHLPELESPLGGILQKSSLEQQEYALQAVPQSSGRCTDVEVDLFSTILTVVQSVAEAALYYFSGNVLALIDSVGKIVQSILLYGICEYL